jgi:ABC-type phosphate/phosphonate transport system substrate-binding protein
VRVLASFGEIPADVIAARADVAQAVRDKVGRALLAASQDRGNHLLLGDLFGADELRRWQPAGYEALRGAVMDASSAGLLEGQERS